MDTEIDTGPTKRNHHHHHSTTRNCYYCNKDKINYSIQKVHIEDDNNVVPDSYPVSINSHKNWEILDTEDPLLITKTRELRVKVDGTYYDSMSPQKQEEHSGRVKRKILRQEKAQQNTSTRKSHKVMAKEQDDEDEETKEDDDDRGSHFEKDKEYYQVTIEGAQRRTKINYDKLNTGNATSNKKTRSISCGGGRNYETKPARSSKRRDLVSSLVD
eukprot:TRINITY_DN8744_c0_g1_i1.p1 TRINITY_DN8744_c0_g1~~TRINITY_DN8744_c0_g1_i1.p1  ORF type:complete len:215 (+),score=50.71 TRINITY_DN8744_c0_g1_i1:108-752(+)